MEPISQTTETDILVRGKPVAGELIGSLSYTEMMLLDLTGERQPRAHVNTVDAVLVALMEHGLTPSTLSTRLVLDAAPEAMQGAIAAGLLAGGSRFLGTIELAAGLLTAVVDGAAAAGGLAESARAEVGAIVEAGGRVPGMGHNIHTNGDPRVEALFAVGRREGTAGAHVEAVASLAAAAHELIAPDLVVNVAAAVASLLCDLGYSPGIIRGFALVSRCGGLFAHVADEARRPVAREIWQAAQGRGAG